MSMYDLENVRRAMWNWLEAAPPPPFPDNREVFRLKCAAFDDPPASHPISAERRDDLRAEIIWDDHLSGKNRSEIASKYDISQARVERSLKRGIPPRMVTDPRHLTGLLPLAMTHMAGSVPLGNDGKPLALSILFVPIRHTGRMLDKAFRHIVGEVRAEGLPAFDIFPTLEQVSFEAALSLLHARGCRGWIFSRDDAIKRYTADFRHLATLPSLQKDAPHERS